KRYLILWDALNHSKKILNRHANIYSAYFIKNSDLYMWQSELNKKVYVSNLKNKVIKEFNPGFYVYSHIVTSDLQYYIASDEHWNLFVINHKHTKLLKKDLNGFTGIGKPIQITLSNDEKMFITSGFGSLYDHDKLSYSVKYEYGFNTISKISFLRGLILWSIEGKPMKRFAGNRAKTFGAITPDDRYILGVDENMLGFIWSAYTERKIRSLDFFNANSPAPTIAIKFLDMNGHYLIFMLDTPFVTLYKLQGAKPIQYVLNATNDSYFNRFIDALSIDSSPSTHILVTGRAHSSGLILYQFNPEKLNLVPIWIAK
ncbi:MAG: hypothetical protein AB7F64_06045, partial [Gammaproteobacteria bacterium]